MRDEQPWSGGGRTYLRGTRAPAPARRARRRPSRTTRRASRSTRGRVGDRPAPPRPARRRRSPISVRRSERAPELHERILGIAGFEQQFGEQLAQRIQAVLHRHVLDARVLAVGGLPHQRQRLVARAAGQRDPRRDSVDLLLRASRPIRIAGFLHRRRSGFIASISAIAPLMLPGRAMAEAAREMRQRIRLWILGRRRSAVPRRRASRRARARSAPASLLSPCSSPSLGGRSPRSGVASAVAIIFAAFSSCASCRCAYTVKSAAW